VNDAPRIRRRLDAPIPQFPELDHCVGRVVEITVLAEGAAELTDAARPGETAAPFCQATIAEGAQDLLLSPDAAPAAAAPASTTAPPLDNGAVRAAIHLEVAPAGDGESDPTPRTPAEEKLEHTIEEFLTEWQRLRRGR
jgi:hypothetical protein